MGWRTRGLGRRGGVLLDFVLAAALVLVGAYALDAMGLTLAHVLHGAARFFGY